MALENWKAQSCAHTGVCHLGQMLIVRSCLGEEGEFRGGIMVYFPMSYT